jgi:signal transduction histidine kinase
VRLERHLEPGGTLHADADKLRRVVVNLLGNALDALEEGRTASPRITIASGESLAGDAAWIRVEDNGPGIEPERLGKIFDPFHTSKAGGTGLGLAITRKLVEAHGGTIEVESRPGSGTVFSLTLPKGGPPGAA